MSSDKKKIEPQEPAKINPHELTLTISLAKEDQNRMQLVYASQLYGTFFGIFGSFDIDYSNNDNLILNGVYLRLINYKGSINIGIKSVADTVLVNKQKDELTIKFKVQALVRNQVLKFYKFKKGVEIKNDSRVFFERNLEKLHDRSDTTGIDHDGVFDSEFYERDGLYAIKNNLRFDDQSDENWKIEAHTGRRYKYSKGASAISTNDNLNYIEGEIAKYPDLSEDEIKILAPGGRCPKSLAIAKY